MPIYKDKGKKDGLQKYKVRVNYTDRTGKAKQMTRIAYGMEDARMLEIKLMQQVKETQPDSHMTLGELFEEYINAKKHNVRTTSWEKTMRLYNQHLKPHFENTRLDKLTKQQMQEWKNHISEQNYKIRYCQNIYSEFRALLNYAVKMEYIQRNPLVLVGNFKDVYFDTNPKIQYYTKDQFKQFMDAAAKYNHTADGYAYYTFFAIAYFTGMRKGEINALRWEDIEDNKIIHVRRSISQKAKGGDVETPPKNRSSVRDLQMPSPLISILEHQLTLQKKESRFSAAYKVCGGAMCLRDTNIANKNIQYATEAKLPIIRVHDFRHSHVSLLANEGINIQEIARRLGHSDIKMTLNTYSHLYPREEERAVSVLNQINL